jgi:hypothetical protein
MVFLDAFKVLIHGIFGDGADPPMDTGGAPKSHALPVGKDPIPRPPERGYIRRRDNPSNPK